MLRKLIMILCLSSISGIAQAGDVDVQVLAGRRWVESNGHGMRGNDLTAAGHYQIFSAVPVSLGGAITAVGYDRENVDAAAGFEFRPELMAWLPLPLVKPYAKLGYSLATIVTSDKTTTDDTKSERTVVDTNNSVVAAVGARIGLLPILNVIAEAGYTSGRMKVANASVKQNGESNATTNLVEDQIEKKEARDSLSKYVSIGAEVVF